MEVSNPNTDMYYVPSLGVLFPTVALRSIQVYRADVEEYEIDGNIDNRVVDPIVTDLRGHADKVTLFIAAEYVPQLVNPDDDSAYVEVSIDMGSHLVRSPIGQPMSEHPLFVEMVQVRQQAAPERRSERREYDRQMEVADKVFNAYRRMSTAVSQYHSTIGMITDPTGTGGTGPADDFLLPASLQARVGNVISQSTESHAATMRKQAEELREKYVKSIDWMERNVFRPSMSEYVPAIMSQEDLGKFMDEFIGVHLILVKFS